MHATADNVVLREQWHLFLAIFSIIRELCERPKTVPPMERCVVNIMVMMMVCAAGRARQEAVAAQKMC